MMPIRADHMSVAVAMLALVMNIAFAQQRSIAQTSVPQPAEETPEMFPAGPHRDETFYFCTPCHNFQFKAAPGHNR